MDLVSDLLSRSDRMADEPLPTPWREVDGLSDVRTFGELVARLRRLDRRSDAAMRALGAVARDGQGEACLIVVAALLPLLLVRCGRRPRLVAESINELAARVSEVADDTGSSSVANRLLRRVVWRVRHEHGQHDWLLSVPDPAAIVPGLIAGDSGEDDAVDRVAMVEFRRRLRALPRGDRAWSVLSASAEPTAPLTSTERTRLLRSRRLIRGLASSTLFA